MLDVISGGRLEFGVGRGYQPRETEVLGGQMGATIQDQERNRAYFEEALRDHPEVLDAGLLQPPRRVLHDPAHRTPGGTTSQTIAYFSEPGHRPQLEDVLDIGAPDMYSAGSPVLATTTKLRELQVYPQPLQKPLPPDVGAADQPALDRVRRPAGHERLLHRRAELPACKQNIEHVLRRGREGRLADRLNRGRSSTAGTPRSAGASSPAATSTSSTRASATWTGPGGRSRCNGTTTARSASPACWPSRRGASTWTARSPPRSCATQGGRTPRHRRLRHRGDHADQEGLRLRGLPVQRLVRAGRLRGSEIEDQMQLFAEEVMPVLRRECGGSPEQAESTVVPGARGPGHPEPASVRRGRR